VIEKRLGKIAHITFGLGGYQDVMFGIHVTLEGEAWGVSSTKSAWDPARMERSKHAAWTEADRSEQLSEICRYTSHLLKSANKRHVSELKDIPIEATFEGNKLLHWRILEEVL
jgi:hypothetical protein